MTHNNFRFINVCDLPNVDSYVEGKLNKILNKIGRKMILFLRHKPIDTFVNVGSVLYEVNTNFLKHFGILSTTDFIYIVKSDKKCRFAVFLDTNSTNENYWVAAAQGHSGNVSRISVIENYLFERVTNIPYLWHGTSSKFVSSIKLYGLSRCSRFHIHMIGPNSEEELYEYNRNAISGYRACSDVLIRVDVGKAMKSGIIFYKSLNGVYLSSGNATGIIPAYFLKVIYLK